jgi:hypothetical protein
LSLPGHKSFNKSKKAECVVGMHSAFFILYRAAS